MFSRRITHCSVKAAAINGECVSMSTVAMGDGSGRPSVAMDTAGPAVVVETEAPRDGKGKFANKIFYFCIFINFYLCPDIYDVTKDGLKR